MSAFTIRQAAEQDVDALVDMRLALQAHLVQRNPACWRLAADAGERIRLELQDELGDPDALLLVAGDGGDVCIGMGIGHVECQPGRRPATVGYIKQLFVAETWRKRGIGKALVARLCGFFADRSVEEVSLRYMIGNVEGERFWLSLGFEPRIVTASAPLSRLEAQLDREKDCR